MARTDQCLSRLLQFSFLLFPPFEIALFAQLSNDSSTPIKKGKDLPAKHQIAYLKNRKEQEGHHECAGQDCPSMKVIYDREERNHREIEYRTEKYQPPGRRFPLLVFKEEEIRLISLSHHILDSVIKWMKNMSVIDVSATYKEEEQSPQRSPEDVPENECDHTRRLNGVRNKSSPPQSALIPWIGLMPQVGPFPVPGLLGKQVVGHRDLNTGGRNVVSVTRKFGAEFFYPVDPEFVCCVIKEIVLIFRRGLFLNEFGSE